MVKEETQTSCREHPGVENLGSLGTESRAFQIATLIQTLFCKVLRTLVNVRYHFYEEKTKKAQRSCCLKFVFHWKRKAKLPFATVLQYNSASLPLQCEQSV